MIFVFEEVGCEEESYKVVYRKCYDRKKKNVCFEL